jgi:hypothetical protein
LHISPHTARDYLKSVRYKLDCVTSAQAASKAINLAAGLIVLNCIIIFVSKESLTAITRAKALRVHDHARNVRGMRML